MNSKKKYLKPKIKSKKVKLSYFLTKLTPIDAFNMVGNVYASSSGGSKSATGGCTNCG